MSPLATDLQHLLKLRNKHGAKRTAYNGRTYASKAEADYAARLDLEVRAGVVRFWIPQPITTLGCAENTYRPDFLVVPVSGEVYFVDVKGHATDRFKKNVRLWKKYGPCPLHIVKGGKTVEVVEGP